MRAPVVFVAMVVACGSSSEDVAPPTKDAGKDVAVDGATDGATDGADDTGIDCSRVGCAAPPLCSTGCTEPCGCCPCADGTSMGGLVCNGGCWLPADAGGD